MRGITSVSTRHKCCRYLVSSYSIGNKNNIVGVASWRSAGEKGRSEPVEMQPVTVHRRHWGKRPKRPARPRATQRAKGARHAQGLELSRGRFRARVSRNRNIHFPRTYSSGIFLRRSSRQVRCRRYRASEQS